MLQKHNYVGLAIQILRPFINLGLESRLRHFDGRADPFLAVDFNFLGAFLLKWLLRGRVFLHWLSLGLNDDFGLLHKSEQVFVAALFVLDLVLEELLVGAHGLSLLLLLLDQSLVLSM
jgi:hypothetical protein